jgi:DNA-binding NarL/FixJ family response regulator
MANLSDLTPREMEVLQLILEGGTNKSIASQLRISKKTVEFHLDNLYTKIGARTRVRVAIWAVGQGIAAEPRVTPS